MAIEYNLHSEKDFKMDNEYSFEYKISNKTKMAPELKKFINRLLTRSCLVLKLCLIKHEYADGKTINMVQGYVFVKSESKYPIIKAGILDEDDIFVTTKYFDTFEEAKKVFDGLNIKCTFKDQEERSNYIGKLFKKYYKFYSKKLDFNEETLDSVMNVSTDKKYINLDDCQKD